MAGSLPKRMIQTLVAEDVVLGGDAPKVCWLELNTAAHATSIAALESIGLDTVRFDRATGRVEVISREFDDPQAAEAARRALDQQEQSKRRWWQKSR